MVYVTMPQRQDPLVTVSFFSVLEGLERRAAAILKRGRRVIG